MVKCDGVKVAELIWQELRGCAEDLAGVPYGLSTVSAFDPRAQEWDNAAGVFAAFFAC